MSVVLVHADIAVTEPAGDDRRGYAVHRRLAGYRVVETVKVAVLSARLAPSAITGQKVAASARAGSPSRARMPGNDRKHGIGAKVR